MRPAMVTATMPRGRLRPENLFFSGMALAILASVFVGFARTYYLAGIFRAPLPNLLIHIHGAAFSLWIVLFVTQTSLVAAGRTDVHRRLGLVGFGLAAVMVVLGVLAATDELGRRWDEPDRLTFYLIPLTDMLLFSILVYSAFRQRRNPAAHKRLILIATIGLLGAAVARWPVHAAWWDFAAVQMACYAPLLALALYDFRTTGRVHRATIWASVLLVVVQQARLPVSRSEVWQSLATRVQRLVTPSSAGGP